MKVGTINFHRSQNYGALMVTYSLLTYLRKNGIDARAIDYFPEHHTSMYPNKNEPYDNFVEKYLKPFGSPDEEYDLVIYGADTIWEYYNGFGYDPTYWGSERIKAKKKITYSASATMKNFSEESDELFRKYIGNFSAVAVREDVLAQYIHELTGREIVHTCDPTFLLDQADYYEIMSKRLVPEEYAVVYNRQLGTKLFEASETVAEKTGLKTVVLKGDGCLYTSSGELIRSDIGPSEFLSLIRYSSYVLAASFHAVAFSIIFGKQFNTIMKSGAERVESLLRRLGLEDRRIEHTSEINMSQKIDYSDMNKFDEYIGYSKKWLLDAVAVCLDNDTYIWGAAIYGASALEYCKDKFDINGFIDRRKSDDFYEFCRLPVFSPEKIQKCCNIIIAVSYPIDVINAIKDNSIEASNIYIFDGRNPESRLLYKVEDDEICVKEYMDKRFAELSEYSLHYSRLGIYVQNLFVSAIKYLSDASDSICELCCGSGQLANMLFDNGFKNYIGVDFSEEAIKLAKRANPSFSNRFVCCDAFEFLEKNDLSKVNVFMIFEALEHLKNDVELMKKLPSGSKIIFSAPTFKSFNHVRTFDNLDSIKERYNNIEISDYKLLKAGGNNIYFHLIYGTVK